MSQGILVSLSQDFGNRFLFFFRYGLNDGKRTELDQMVSVGGSPDQPLVALGWIPFQQPARAGRGVPVFHSRYSEFHSKYSELVDLPACHTFGGSPIGFERG